MLKQNNILGRHEFGWKLEERIEKVEALTNPSFSSWLWCCLTGWPGAGHLPSLSSSFIISPVKFGGRNPWSQRKPRPKNWCFWTVVLEKTLESPLDCKEIQPVHPKGDQSWVFIGRTDVEAETPILWPPDAKSWLIGKDPDAGRDWGQEEKGTTEDEMVGLHHRLNGHEFE